MFENPSFETGDTTGWSITGSGFTYSVATSGGYNSPDYLLLTQGGSDVSIQVSQSITITSSVQVQLSGYAMALSNMMDAAKGYLFVTDANGNQTPYYTRQLYVGGSWVNYQSVPIQLDAGVYQMGIIITDSMEQSSYQFGVDQMSVYVIC